MPYSVEDFIKWRQQQTGIAPDTTVQPDTTSAWDRMFLPKSVESVRQKVSPAMTLPFERHEIFPKEKPPKGGGTGFRRFLWNAASNIEGIIESPVAHTPLGKFRMFMQIPEIKQAMQERGKDYARVVNAGLKPTSSKYFDEGWYGYAFIPEFWDMVKEDPVLTAMELGMLKTGIKSIGKKVGLKTGVGTEVMEQVAGKVDQATKPLRFYPDAPPELRNDIRVGPIQMSRDIQAFREQLRNDLWGNLSEGEVQQAVDLIYARDAVGRTKAGLGKPGVTLGDAMVDLTIEIERSMMNPEVWRAADRWKSKSNESRAELVRRGKLEEGEGIESYAPHLVEGYTPDWAPVFGIPRKMRRPYRPYTKQAKGTEKAYRQDSETLVDHLARVELDNMLEDWLKTEASKFDITPKLTTEQKAAVRGDKGLIRFPDAEGEWHTIDPINHMRPGRIVEIEGKTYRAYSPDKPFSNQLYPVLSHFTQGSLIPGKFKTLLETGEMPPPSKAMALGMRKRTYLVPDAVYQTFEQFNKPAGGRPLYLLNQANAYGKSLAILSHYPSFHFNNFVGDMFLITMQHPKPHRFFGSMGESLKMLTKSPEKYSAYEKGFSEFLKNNSVVDATFIKELPSIYKSGNPLKQFLAKTQEISQFRESIQRVANAKYLYDEMLAGRGEAVRKQWDWINTEGLKTEQALGKIARDSFVDYEAVSKMYRGWVRGFALPFGTWYLKMSDLVWRHFSKHPIKTTAALSALPVMASVFNHRSPEVVEMERKLPQTIRDERIHFVLGETPEGRIKTLVLQTPQDALIGTKIFTVAINQANQVYNKEKTIEQAAKDLLKNWGVAEAKGIAYLMNPAVRLLRGFMEQRDPYDKQPLYPIDPQKLSRQRIWWYRMVYAQKCLVPFLSAYIADTEGRLKPRKEAAKDLLNDFIGLPALGIRDYTPKAEIPLPGGATLDYELLEEMRDIQAKESHLLYVRIPEEFIKSGLSPKEYYQSERFFSMLENLAKLNETNISGLFEMDTWASIEKSIRYQIENDPLTYKFWVQNKIDIVETDEEKRKWGKVAELLRQGRLIEGFERLPKSIQYLIPSHLKQKP